MLFSNPSIFHAWNRFFSDPFSLKALLQTAEGCEHAKSVLQTTTPQLSGHCRLLPHFFQSMRIGESTAGGVIVVNDTVLILFNTRKNGFSPLLL